MKIFTIILIFNLTNLFSSIELSEHDKIKKLINDLNNTHTKKIIEVSIEKRKKQASLAKYDFIEDMWNNVYGKDAKISGNDIKQSMNNIMVPMKKVDTVFYLCSLGVNIVSFNNFFVDAQRLKGDMLYFGGLNGMPTVDSTELLLKTIDRQNIINNVEYKIKVTPYFYKDLNITEVPAYIFAKCPNKKDGSFKHKNCNYNYLIRGDITLTKALEIVSSKNKHYKQFYKKMIVKE